MSTPHSLNHGRNLTENTLEPSFHWENKTKTKQKNYLKKSTDDKNKGEPTSV